MTDRPLYLLSPYRPPTSYPVTLNPDEASAWLNGYAALWHPAALAGAAGPPTAASAYDHDRPTAGGLYAIPDGPTLFLPDDWTNRLEHEKAAQFKATADRAETFAGMIEAVRTLGGGSLLDVPSEVARLFAGVGYGLLMLDTLFDAMGHERLLDAVAFWADVTAAVEACRTDASQSRSHLVNAAEKLKVAREGAYSGNVFLLDWLTLDQNDLGREWPASLRNGVPCSLLTSGELLEKLLAEEPAKFAELKSKVPAGLPPTVELCVGAYRERDDALLPVESQLWNLARGRDTVKALFGTEPTVYARRRSAYHPQLPSWLSQLGYRNAISVAFDGALVPTRYSAVVSWAGPDGKSVDAFARDPHPADAAPTFFNLGYHFYQAIQHDSTPTLPLLHKSGPPAAGYDDLLAVSELADVFGRWAGMGGYFAETHAGDYAGAANADEFFADYLDDRVSNRHRPDAASGFARHLRRRKRVESAFALSALLQTLSPEPVAVGQLEVLETAVELDGPDVGPSDELTPKLEAAESEWAKRLMDRLQARSPDNQPGVMVLNPCGFPRRVTIELADQPGPIAIDGPVKASEFDAGTARLVVEVPGLGFAWIPKGSVSNAPSKPRLKTAEETTVRNEFLEADLDPTTGGLRAFRDSRTRVNRLGQMLVFNPGSKMVCDRAGVVRSGSALGEVLSEGRIVNEHDAPLASFRQRLRAWVGRPVLELRIEITPDHKPTGYPWHSYFGSRFVWRDERATTFRAVNGSTAQSVYPRPVSPDFVEFRLGKERTFLFLGGLPFVQKHGKRMLDVVLIPEGETETTFDFLLAADREHPMAIASGWTAPAPIVTTSKGPPSVGASGWLAAVDLPSLLLLGLRPAGPGRAVVGRFAETAGFAGAAELRFARDPQSAKLTDPAGGILHDLAMNGDAVPLDFSAGELIGVRAEWA